MPGRQTWNRNLPPASTQTHGMWNPPPIRHAFVIWYTFAYRPDPYSGEFLLIFPASVQTA